MHKPYQRLDHAMNQRRLELGIRYWRDLATAAGISYETLRTLRKGEGQATEGTKRALERTLQWAPGSIDVVLAGGEPTPLDTRTIDQVLADIEARQDEIDKRLRRAADIARSDPAKRRRLEKYLDLFEDEVGEAG